MLSQPSRAPLALIMTLVAFAISILTSCGWRGEPVHDGIEIDDDTIYNDLTYTAVTGGITSISAVAVTLKGYANSSKGYLAEFDKQGFLLSRYNSNPTLDDVGGENVVREVRVDEVEDDNSMKTRVYGLLPYTQFYYRAYVVKKDGEKLYGVVKTFMTLNMTVALDIPSRTGLFDCDMNITVTGFGAGDHGNGATVELRYADAKITGATTLPDGGAEPSTNKIISATSVGDSPSKFTCTPSGLTPGEKYYAVAYVRIESDFYNYDKDNPLKSNGQYTYGTEPEGVETDRYESEVVELSATALAGLRSYAGKNYELVYDAITIKDSYFTIPSDTMEVTEYGIILSEGDNIDSENQIRVVCDNEVGKGNKYDTYYTGLKLKTKYCYKSYVIVYGFEVTSKETYTFETKNYTPVTVDLGLSVKWADRNLGAYAENSAGAYYAWGETTTKKSYDDNTFKGATLADTEIGGTDKDAATAIWGDGWRLPTCAEVKELYDECEWKWTNEDGMSGFLIVGPNDNTIFLPASGIKINAEVQDLGKSGYFWTSERHSAENDYGFAYELYIVNGITHSGSSDPYPILRKCLPIYGLNIRPVYTGN